MGDELTWLSEEQIGAALSQALLEAGPPPAHPLGLIRAAVLIPFLRMEDGWYILFTRRTDRLEHHKGQVAFPGGTADAIDSGPAQTALRETFEEIGVDPLRVRVIGQMAEMATFTGFLITPIVGVVEWPTPLQLEEAEVSRAFWVPLAWLGAGDHYELRPYLRPNGEKEMVVYFQIYDQELIWGVTGRIMLNLIRILTKK